MSRTWTDKQENFIRKNIHLTNKELAEKLARIFKHRTEGHVRSSTYRQLARLFIKRIRQ